MKLKIGVIGNSHLAAFKLGWELIKTEFTELEMIFFGSPATSMRLLRVDGNALVPTVDLVRENFLWTSGGRDSIPGDLDAYILVGMGFSFIHLMAILRNHRLPELYVPSNDEHQLISENFFQNSMEATLANSGAMMVIAKLKQISTAPLVYVPNPFGTNEVLGDPAYDYYLNEKIRERAFSFYNESIDRMQQNECVVVQQPNATIADRMFTKIEYSHGSIKLKKGMSSSHNINDYFHMNARFGALSLREILATRLPILNTTL